MSERGTWRNKDRARQLLCFEGLRWGTITPTDFDLFIDFYGRGFVLGEIKHKGTSVKRGQELALERAADAWDRAGVPCLTIVAEHDVDIGDVVVADAVVVRYRWGGRWSPMRRNDFTVAEILERFHRRVLRRAA